MSLYVVNRATLVGCPLAVSLREVLRAACVPLAPWDRPAPPASAPTIEGVTEDLGVFPDQTPHLLPAGFVGLGPLAREALVARPPDALGSMSSIS